MTPSTSTLNSHLIPVFKAENQQLLCNARELHAFLDVGRDFSNWIKGRIEQYGFVEAEDYITVQNFCSPNPASKDISGFDSPNPGSTNFDSPDPANQKSGRGGDRRSIEYHLTIGMAKELAMIENNEAGRRVRRYFIQREKQAIELLQQKATEVQPIEQVKKRIKDTPKFRYLLILQEQSRKLASQLSSCTHPNERFNLHCSLRQVNNCLGIPTDPLELWEDSEQAKISG